MIDDTIYAFTEAAVQEKLITELDRIYIHNRLLDLLKKPALEERTIDRSEGDLLSLLDRLVDYAVSSGILPDSYAEKDQFSSKIMDLLTPLPSRVNEVFWDNYKCSPKAATDSFYQLSRKNDYIKTRAIAQNIAFTHHTPFGELEITINLSKPEKDSKQIALEKDQVSTSYPSCLLCMENEGYKGSINQPARANHRLIRLEVNQESWGFQYSPYAYYNEHAIFLSSVHRPMDVGKQAIQNLLEIITILPHYFVGSNAGLPIVGGSILSHDHYQGGRHVFPMERAGIWFSFSLAGFPSVKAGLVNWPMSVVRLTGVDRKVLADAAAFVMEKWAGYTDPEAGIFSKTEETPHNAVTPIARRRGEQYELDLVLRNNRTSEEFPDGIFHPHPDVQHIKKENIGLIEVMGLAILPPRLKEEMNEVSLYLLDKTDHVTEYHQAWADRLKERTPGITEATVGKIIEEGIGDVFLRVLTDAAVFKPTDTGRDHFMKFTNALKENR